MIVRSMGDLTALMHDADAPTFEFGLPSIEQRKDEIGLDACSLPSRRKDPYWLTHPRVSAGQGSVLVSLFSYFPRIISEDYSQEVMSC